MSRLFLTGLVSIALGCSAAMADETTMGDRIDDAATTARVKTALMSDETAKARQIEVETKNGVVQLSGFVDSEASIEAAVKTAAQVEGVTEVHNDLVVREGERSAGQAVDDTVIAAKVKAQIAGDTDLSTANDVNVEVNQGVVQLSGFVASIEQKNKVADVASSVEGVVDVRNDVVLEEGL